MKLKVISAVLVFLVITIVQLVINLLAGVDRESNADGENPEDIWSCSKKFINGVEPDDKDTNDSNE